MRTFPTIIKNCCTAAICWTLVFAGCRRSVQISETAPKPIPPAYRQASPIQNLDPAGEPEPSATAADTGGEGPRLDSLEQRYLQATDPEEKSEVMAKIADLPDATAVTALGRLFRAEPSADLRSSLLGAIIGREENVPVKLETFNAALSPAQPLSVRQVAIAGLMAMGTPEAREILQRMRYDSDPAIRTEAAEALDVEP